MAQIVDICRPYSEDDIFNMDETGLYWKMTPSRGLSIISQPGLKKEKSRVTLVPCCNASGKEKLRLWVIGKAKTPRALRRINVSAMGAECAVEQKGMDESVYYGRVVNGVLCLYWFTIRF